MTARTWRRVLGAVGLGLCFACAFVVATVLHLGLPPGKRVLGRALVAFLDGTFQGHFELGAIVELSSSNLLVERFVVRDPKDRVVLDAARVRVRASLVDIARELLDDDGKTTIAIEHTRIERAKVLLAPERGRSELGLVSAFTPRPKAPEPGAVPRPIPRVWLGNVEIGRGDVHLELRGLPVLDAVVTQAKGQVLVSSVGVAVDAARFSAVVRGLLAKELRAVGSFHQRGTTHFWSSLDGYAGDLQFDSIVRLDGRRLAVTLDVPRGEPAAVRELLPAWPLLQTATAHVEAKGELPTLALDSTATVGAAHLDAKGTLELSPELRLRLATRGSDIDLNALFEDIPPTSVTARVALDLTSTERGVELTTDGESDPTIVGGIPVPGAKFQARYAAKGLTGTATLHEQGMPLDATFTLAEGGAFDADVRASRFRIEQAPRVAGIVKARGAASFKLKAHLEKDRLEASTSADLDDMVLGSVRLGRGRLSATGKGLVSAPKELAVEGSLEGSSLRWGELAFDSVSAKVSGPLSRLSISAKLAGERGASVEASTRLAAIGGTRLDDVELSIARDGKALHARAGRVELRGESVELADVALDGAGGTLTGSGRYRPGLLEVDARGKELDLGVISHVVGFSGQRLRGKLDVNAELAIARDVRRGTLSLGVHDAAYGPIGGVTLELATSLDGESVDGNAVLAVDGIGRARASFDASVPGALFEAKSWEHAAGRWDLGLERLELAQVRPWLPEAWQVRELKGIFVAQASLQRDEPTSAPEITLLGATDGLVVVRGAKSDDEPLVISGIEAQLSASVDGKQNQAQADVRLVDEHGLLASASGRVELDVMRALAAPSTIWSDVKDRPIVATLVTDGRPLAQLPEPIRPTGAAGTLRAELGLRGTLAEPRLVAKGSLERLTLGDSPEVVPFDACATLQYDPQAQRLGLGAQAHLSAGGRPCSGPRVLVGSATGTVDPDALAAGERGFHGDAQLGVEDFPLGLVPVLAESGMVGRVRGTVALTDSGELPSLSARLRLSDIAVRNIPVGSGDLTLRSDGRALRAGVRLERAGGTLDVDARSALVWDRRVPGLDPSQPLLLEAKIHDIDAAILSPVVGDVLADLSGRLDGNVALTLAPGAPGKGVSELDGKLSLTNGALQLAGLGMRLSRVRFDAFTRKTGARTVISVRDLSAASGADYQNVSATADIYLNGLALFDARANVNLRGVPLMIEGVSQAKLTGGATMELFAERDPMLVAISLHDLTAELPRSSGRAVLGVDDNPDVSVKQPLREPTREARGDGMRWQLAFDLARKVKITRSDMEIPLRGRPVVDLGKRTDVSGDLELQPGGRVQLLGKGFVIESGEVHFDTEDPADPHLRVLASWRAPDGTVVYVEIGGTVREATLRLESDPPLSQTEIQALLLGGGAGEGAEAQAAGIGYGADFVGQLLADTPLHDVSVRTGSETTGDDLSYSTYNAGMPISENVWVELSYKNAESTSPGTEHSDAASATVDWRFKRNWTLRTEAGTIGTGLDLLWQYRY